MKKVGLGKILFGVIAFLTVLLNILFWTSQGFSDFFVQTIFPFFTATYGRLTGILPFSLGEWMLLLGVVLTVVFLVLCLILLISFIKELITHKHRNAKRFRAFIRGYQIFYAWVVCVVAFVMTCNCFSLYHTSTIREEWFDTSQEIEPEEMLRLWNYVADHCNRLSVLVPRDDAGNVICDTGEDSLENQAKLDMQKLGESVSRLDGFYPTPKRMYFSDFMCQQHMQGYYFPFSMEANINDVMNPLRKPSTFCHELCHVKGYLLEDEANFLSFLACTGSDDVISQYSGYLAVLNYCSNEMNQLFRENPRRIEEWEFVRINVLVDHDNYFVDEETWERINKEAWIETETVTNAAQTFIDGNLKFNGIKDGAHSYSRVIELLLRYYKTHEFQM